MYGTQDSENTFLFIFLEFIVLLLTTAYYLRVIAPFIADRHYIKMEINRSVGGEYRYWKRELKKLYLCNIPILGWLFRWYYSKHKH